jgi:hypothetical protein
VDSDPNIPAKPCLYSLRRTDRSGSAIMDQLYAHAYAHSIGKTYCGACIESGFVCPERFVRPDGSCASGPVGALAVEEDTRNLLGVLGLAQQLPLLECPAENITHLNSYDPIRCAHAPNLARSTYQRRLALDDA